MSNIHFLDDRYAFPIEHVDIVLGPLDPEWQPSRAHIAIVSGIHTFVSAGVALGIVAAVAFICFAIGG